MTVAAELQPHLRPIADLHPLAGNPRQGDIGAIVGSLERFGQVKPIIVDEAGVILAGNHVYAAAKALGWTHIAAVTVPMEAAEALAYSLADNRLSELGSYDLPALQVMLDIVDLDGTGYEPEDQEDLRRLLDDPLSLTDDLWPTIYVRVPTHTWQRWHHKLAQAPTTAPHEQVAWLLDQTP